MTDKYDQQIAALPPAKAFAIGLYGEHVASYRYRVLAEKVRDDVLREVFLDMAGEEHGHHQLLARIRDEHYPGTDFVLSPEDKELIIVGPRMLEIGDGPSIRRALDMIHDSEQRTGKFYAALEKAATIPDLKPVLKEMADECFDHASRLLELDLSNET